MALDLYEVESQMRGARALLQKVTGEDYCSISIDGNGKLMAYVHDAGGHHSADTLAEAMEAARLASAPADRAARLRAEARKAEAEAERLEAICEASRVYSPTPSGASPGEVVSLPCL